ncbi:hypothetical protein NQ315_004524 [Exocentrus adspersus]|uniref:Uncharacterized protein n=1 Tax=Exocentrus adspersus TaxID=1586481 RepID=A0AAV8V7M1_9CUCU|nr:hypothetical protein NQ315_004524 [Exocentrus adspersus]
MAAASTNSNNQLQQHHMNVDRHNSYGYDPITHGGYGAIPLTDVSGLQTLLEQIEDEKPPQHMSFRLRGELRKWVFRTRTHELDELFAK